MQGEDAVDFRDYQKSKADMHLSDEKYSHIRTPLRDLRRFGRKYLEAHSIVRSLNPGEDTKDEDYVVRLVKRLENGTIILNDNKENISLTECPTYMQDGDIGKLRSVAQIRVEDGERVVCKNNFTSLIKIPEWSFDAQSFINSGNAMEDENEDIYTPLNELLVMTAGIFIINSDECADRVYNVKC